MKRYRPAELQVFLRALDAELSRDTPLVVIGGAALALGYGSPHATKDVDLMTVPPPDFRKAVERAADKTGLRIPISPVGIVEGPEGLEERLEPLDLGQMKRLRIFVPERHDLALMKVARGEEADMQGIEDIHSRNPLDLSTLIQRYREVLPIGSENMFRIKFLDLVARLFGEARADRLDVELRPTGRT